MVLLVSLAKIYYFVLQYSPAIPLFYGLRNRKSLDQPLRYFLWYLGLSLGLTIIMTFLALNGIHNLWLTNISLPFYAAILLWTLSLWLHNPRMKSSFRLAIIPFVILWAAELIITREFFKFTAYAGPVLNILLVFASLYVIYDANSSTDLLLTDMPLFWICAGVVLTFGGLLVITLLSQPLLNLPTEAFRTVLLFQPMLNLVVHVLYLVGYVRQCRK